MKNKLKNVLEDRETLSISLKTLDNLILKLLIIKLSVKIRKCKPHCRGTK